MYGKVILEFKTKQKKTYAELRDELFQYYPGRKPTRQTIENWAAERNYPDMITLAIIDHNAPKGSWQRKLAKKLLDETFNDKIRQRLKEIGEK